MLKIVVLLGLLAFAGCSKDIKCEVRSDTSWSGAFGDRTVDGAGSTTVDLPDDSPQCCVVQKETESGYLEIQVISEGSGFLNPTTEGNAVRTTAAYGVVSACDK